MSIVYTHLQHILDGRHVGDLNGILNLIQLEPLEEIVVVTR